MILSLWINKHEFMKYFSLLIVAGVLLFSACKNGNNSPKTAKELLEQAAPNMNKGAGKFTIETPAGWRKVDTTFNGIKAIMLFAPDMADGFRPSLNVVTENMGNNSLQQYVDKNVSTMQQYMANFKLLDKGEKDINGIPSRWLKYTATSAQGGKELAAIVYAVPRNGIVYNITGVTTAGAGISISQFSKIQQLLSG
jgi:hypothetical protein